jgi:hypothetical protein
MPSGSVKEQDGVTAGRHLAADLLEMQALRHWHKARPKPRRYRDEDRQRRICRPTHDAGRAARPGGCRARPKRGSACLAGQPGLHPATKVRSVFRAHARG